MQIPQLAALHHNDCWHLASQLFMLPQRHAPQLEQLVGENAGLVDAALHLRQQGSACLAQQVRTVAGASCFSARVGICPACMC